jgi:hypothetical protein
MAVFRSMIYRMNHLLLAKEGKQTELNTTL